VHAGDSDTRRLHVETPGQRAAGRRNTVTWRSQIARVTARLLPKRTAPTSAWRSPWRAAIDSPSIPAWTAPRGSTSTKRPRSAKGAWW